MAQLMGDHARDLTLGLGGLDHAAIHIHRPARQGERIDLADVHDLEGVAKLRVLKLARQAVHQAVPDTADVRRHQVVPQDRELLFNLPSGLQTKLNVLGGAVFVRRRRDRRLPGNDADGCQQGDG